MTLNQWRAMNSTMIPPMAMAKYLLLHSLFLWRVAFDSLIFKTKEGIDVDVGKEADNGDRRFVRAIDFLIFLVIGSFYIRKLYAVSLLNSSMKICAGLSRQWPVSCHLFSHLCSAKEISILSTWRVEVPVNFRLPWLYAAKFHVTSGKVNLKLHDTQL